MLDIGQTLDIPKSDQLVRGGLDISKSHQLVEGGGGHTQIWPVGGGPGAGPLLRPLLRPACLPGVRGGHGGHGAQRALGEPFRTQNFSTWAIRWTWSSFGHTQIPPVGGTRLDTPKSHQLMSLTSGCILATDLERQARPAGCGPPAGDLQVPGGAGSAGGYV